MSLFNFDNLLEDADALILIPPFLGNERPALGPHILQSFAKKAGIKVNIFYASLAFTRFIGEDLYLRFWSTMTTALGEKFFARAAYGLPSFGTTPLEEMLAGEDREMEINSGKLRELEGQVTEWITGLTESILKKNYKIIGSSNSFEQTNASIAILNKIKELDSERITIMGGVNCYGEMAEGIETLSPSIDYIFSGESEYTFMDFLQQVLVENKRPGTKIIEGAPLMNLDEVPPPDYYEYYSQLKALVPESILMKNYHIMLTYETSRGCFWGEKKPCYFCGMNAGSIKYRQKSPEKAIAEIKGLLQKHVSRKVAMTDSLIPNSYYKDFVPRLSDEIPNIQISYEVRSSIGLDKLQSLKKAGIVNLQPGIEALSTSLLKRMNKGILARQNLQFLRNTRILDINCAWNLLAAFPDDTIEEYRETLELIKYIPHLEPPYLVTPMAIDRFSHYYNNCETYGIQNLRPIDLYSSYLPAWVNLKKIAYHFQGDFNCHATGENSLLPLIKAEVKAWDKTYQSPDRAKLVITRIAGPRYMLVDTRRIDDREDFKLINEKRARVLLRDTPTVSSEMTEEIEWALENKLVLLVDGWYISLVISAPELRETARS